MKLRYTHAQVKDGIAKIQAHKRRYAVRKSKHRRESSFGSTTFTDGESDSEDETEFCGSGEWAGQGVSGVETEVGRVLFRPWWYALALFVPFRVSPHGVVVLPLAPLVYHMPEAAGQV